MAFNSLSPRMWCPKRALLIDLDFCLHRVRSAKQSATARKEGREGKEETNDDGDREGAKGKGGKGVVLKIKFREMRMRS